MGEEFPGEAAFDSQGNPLFTSDGNLASAADAARFPDADLYAYGESLHSGPVYDGRGHQVRGSGRPVSVSLPSSGDFIDDAIGGAVGCAVWAAIFGFFYLVSGPLDRWLMKKAKEQTSRAHELENEVASVRGLNFGGLFFVPWIWMLLFLRLPFALITIALTSVVAIIPLFGQLCYLLMLGLILIRGNEWAWYSGKWATVDDLMAAKRQWAHVLLGIWAVLLVIAIAQSAF